MTGRLSDRAANAATKAVSEWVRTTGEQLTASVVDDLARQVVELKAELGRGTKQLRVT